MKLNTLIKPLRALAALTFLALTAAPASAAFKLYDTGTDNAGNLIAPDAPDPHWSITNPANAVSAPVRGFDFPGIWVNEVTTAGDSTGWIKPNATDLTAFPGTPTGNGHVRSYKTTFDLAGYDPSTAFINLRWAADDIMVGMRLNGTPLSIGPVSGGYTVWSPLSITSGFVQGVNIFEVLVGNVDAATGMIVDFVDYGAKACGNWVAGRDLAANERVTATETLNPNATVPAWSYGYRSTLASSALTLFTPARHVNNSLSNPGLDGFVFGVPGIVPEVVVNTRSTPLVRAGLSNLNPDEIEQHPGEELVYSVVRWTAPAAGLYSISATWRDIDPNGAAGAVDGASGHIVINGTSIYNRTWANGGPGVAVSYPSVVLGLGDRVDFAVGAGANYFADSTAFDATITPVVNMVYDSFTRTGALAGSAADSGQVWTGGSAAFTTNGTQMNIASTAPSSAQIGSLTFATNTVYHLSTELTQVTAASDANNWVAVGFYGGTGNPVSSNRGAMLLRANGGLQFFNLGTSSAQNITPAATPTKLTVELTTGATLATSTLRYLLDGVYAGTSAVCDATTINSVFIQNVGDAAARVDNFTLTRLTPGACAPVIAITGEPVITKAEGATRTVTGTFSDGNGNATVVLTASTGTVAKEDRDGSWTWSPPVTDGPSSGPVTITATDSTGLVRTVRFTCNVTNVPPLVTCPGPATGVCEIPASFTFTATDPSSADQAAGFSWSINYGDGTAAQSVPAGTASPIVRNHTFATTGTYTVTATATDKDGGVSAVCSRAITITPGTAPTISNIADVIINEDAATAAIGFTVADADGHALTVTATSSNTTLLPNANITLAGTGGSRTIRCTPVANQCGTTTVTVTVRDACLSTTETFIVTVNCVNDPPSCTFAAVPTVIGCSGPVTRTGFVTSSNPGPNDESTQTITYAITWNSNPGMFLAGGLPAITPNGSTLTYNPGPGGGTATITVTKTDSGGTANGGINTATATFTITVTPDTAPTISIIPGGTANEDGVVGPISFTIGDVDPNTTLTVTAVSNNQALLPDSGIVLGGSGNTRNLTATPIPNQNGTATITVTISDGCLTATSTSICVWIPVNDPPSCTLAAVPTVIGCSGPVTRTGFVTSSNPGPNEAGQTIVYAITGNSNPGMFLAGGLPAISPNGSTLTYNPGPGGGTATITVTKTDSGGTANGGINTATATFTITVTPNTAPTISNIADVAINQNASTGVINFTVNDADPGTTLVVTASSDNPTLLPSAIIVLGGTGSARTIQCTPASNQSGTVTVTVSVTDGCLTATDTFVITVLPPVTTGPPVLACGWSVATCFSGAARGGPNSGASGYVLGQIDTNPASLPNWGSANNAPPTTGMYHHPDWTRRRMGEVFGVTLDHQANPNTFVAATAIYNTSHFWGYNQWPADGSAGDTFGTFGKPGGIYCIDGTTGAVGNYAEVPNAGLPAKANTPGSLGNLFYDSQRRLIFVSNLDNGKIYSIPWQAACPATPYTATNGVQVVFDHGLNGRDKEGLAILPDSGVSGVTAAGRRVWAVHVWQNRLYYSVWNEATVGGGTSKSNNANTEIWSVAFTPGPGGTVDPATTRLEIDSIENVTPATILNSMPVSDMTISNSGAMMLAQRGCRVAPSPADVHMTTHGILPGMIDTNGPHNANVHQFRQNAALDWVRDKEFNVGQFSLNTNAAGGIDIDCDETVLATGNALAWGSPNTQDNGAWYGLQVIPNNVNPNGNAGTLIANSHIIDFNPDWALNSGGVMREATKSTPGDVALYKCPCPCFQIVSEQADCRGTTLRWTVTLRNTSSIAISSLTFGALTAGVTKQGPAEVILPTAMAVGEIRTFNFDFTIPANPPAEFCFEICATDNIPSRCCTMQFCIRPECCLHLADIRFDSLGGNNWNFCATVTNLSGVTATRLILANTTPGGKCPAFTNPIIALTPPLAHGQSRSFCAPFAASAFCIRLNFSVSLHDASYRTCCSRTLSYAWWRATDVDIVRDPVGRPTLKIDFSSMLLKDVSAFSRVDVIVDGAVVESRSPSPPWHIIDRSLAPGTHLVSYVIYSAYGPAIKGPTVEVNVPAGMPAPALLPELDVNLQLRVTDQGLTLTWDDDTVTLETSTDLSDWEAVRGASSPYFHRQTEEPRRFFRLARP
jgi:hypothetical protein